MRLIFYMIFIIFMILFLFEYQLNYIIFYVNESNITNFMSQISKKNKIMFQNKKQSLFLDRLF